MMSECLVIDTLISLILKVLFTLCNLSQLVTASYLSDHAPLFAPLATPLVHAAVVTKLSETVLNLAIPEDIHPTQLTILT